MGLVPGNLNRGVFYIQKEMVRKDTNLLNQIYIPQGLRTLTQYEPRT